MGVEITTVTLKQLTVKTPSHRLSKSNLVLDFELHSLAWWLVLGLRKQEGLPKMLQSRPKTIETGISAMPVKFCDAGETDDSKSKSSLRRFPRANFRLTLIENARYIQPRRPGQGTNYAFQTYRSVYTYYRTENRSPPQL